MPDLITSERRPVIGPKLSRLRTRIRSHIATSRLADIADYDEMNRVWREFFPVNPPARTSCALQLSNGNGVEIECVALAGADAAEGR